MEVIWERTEEDERALKEWAEWAIENRLPPFTIAESIGMEKGREEGRQEGRQEGREEGMEKGIEKGSLLERYNLVMNMASKIASAEEIAHLTGVPIDEVQQILASRN